MIHRCPGHPDGRADYDCTSSLDSWEELLDGPTSVGFLVLCPMFSALLAMAYWPETG